VIVIGMDIDGMDGRQEIGQYPNVRTFARRIKIVIDLLLEQRICMGVGVLVAERQIHIILVIVQLQQTDIRVMVGDGGVQVISGVVKYMIRKVSHQKKICNI